MNLVPAHPFIYFKIHFNILSSAHRSFKWSLSFRFPQIFLLLHTFKVFTYFTLSHLVTQIIFGEEYQSWGFPLGSFVQYPITSSYLGPNIFLSTLFSNTVSLYFSFNVTDQVSHPHDTAKFIQVYLCVFG